MVSRQDEEILMNRVFNDIQERSVISAERKLVLMMEKATNRRASTLEKQAWPPCHPMSRQGVGLFLYPCRKTKKNPLLLGDF